VCFKTNQKHIIFSQQTLQYVLDFLIKKQNIV